MIACRQAVPADAAWIAPKLRAADALEVHRLGLEPFEALRGGIERSEMAGVFVADGEPLCAFGLERTSFLTPRVGCPWMLGTDALDRHKKPMLVETRRWVEEWWKDYDCLIAWVDVEYAGSIRWLRWLGFGIRGREALGPAGSPFWRMTWER